MVLPLLLAPVDTGTGTSGSVGAFVRPLAAAEDGQRQSLPSMAHAGAAPWQRSFPDPLFFSLSRSAELGFQEMAARSTHARW